VVPFDQTRADESAEEFVAEVLVAAAGARLVVVGRDFHFGRPQGRRGGCCATRERSRASEVEPVALSAAGGDVVSSTRIRQLIAEGKVADAHALLGRPPPGARHRWCTATAGAARARLSDGQRHGARRYRGARRRHLRRPLRGRLGHGAHGRDLGRAPPTFYAQATESLVEAYLLDFEGDLYGQHARVSFVEHLREERRFGARSTALIEQMGTRRRRHPLLLGGPTR